ncbi:MAG: hypothetical protein M1827_000520 [Pycnora praestabilis]|nr:MAG: hypothetical protein M1827_000520 [Pycnora praestabilis]
MNSDPPDGAVDAVVGVTGINHDQAARLLKAHANHTDRALNAYFEDPVQAVAQKNDTWDESQFHTNKTDHEYQNQDVPCEDPWQDMDAFNIHAAPESLGPSVFAAPSRPPSRVNNRDTIDLTAEHAAADASKSLTQGEIEDRQLQQALEMSMSGHLPQQETGVTGPTEFGPANREHYETNKWAMTLPGSSTHEIYLSPEPVHRRREDHEPAFIRPSTSLKYLGALITILHAIPLAREALLFTPHTLPEYGQDNEWWEGSPVKVPRIVTIGEENHQTDWHEIIYETQRLIAFLDMTDRAYGSVDVLANLDNLKDQGPDNVTGNFLKLWQTAATRAAPNSDLTNIFRSVGLKNSEEVEWLPFWCLEVNVDSEITDKNQTLYDALDEIIWADDYDEPSLEETYLEAIGEVFTLRINRQSIGNGLGIRIPSVWYPDRYLKACKGLATDMRIKKAEVRKDLQKMDLAQLKLTEYNDIGGNGKKVDARKLLKTTIAHFERPDLINQKHKTDIGEEDISMQSQSLPSGHADAAKELKAIYERITGKLQALDNQKEKARSTLKQLSNLLTHRSENPEDPPHHFYTLRGVSTEPHTTYVLHKVDKDAMDSTPDALTRGWQWWKLDYSAVDTRPLSTKKVMEVQVLKAAREDSRSALLVYASEKAVNEKIVHIPRQLENFVRADNLAFDRELNLPASPISLPRTSPKRKAADDGDPQWGGMSFSSSSTNTPPLPRSKPLTPPHRKGYDDRIPTSLRGTSPQSVDLAGLAKHSSDDLTDDLSSGAGGVQEMEERGGHGRLLSQMVANALSRSDTARLSDVDEVMEDVEDGNVRRAGAVRVEHVEHARETERE